MFVSNAEASIKNNAARRRFAFSVSLTAFVKLSEVGGGWGEDRGNPKQPYVLKPH